MPHVSLAIVEGEEAGRDVPLTGRLLVGRDPSGDVTVDDPEVSTRHAAFVPGDDGVVVEDLDSTNGTFVNGQRLSGSRQLQAGDSVRLGNTVLEVRAPAPAAEQTEAVMPEVAVTRQRQIPTLPVLVFVAGQNAGSEITVGVPVVLGRDPGVADVVLDKDDEISRRHASFTPSGAGLTVADLGSTNGTFVNGQRAAGAVPLGAGDRVEVGLPPEMVVERPAPAPAPPGEPALPPNSIEVEGLVRQFGDHRAVDGIDLVVNPGEIYGFLGPNGAGKSTTVHMLVTLLPPSSGKARVAGFDVATQGAEVRGSIGVALQAAALDPYLNAWEHMDLQTALQGVPRSERKQRGKELLERVELTGAADRRVGGYSGGMKRRLDLALALVHRPRVLFLDEPTTGLDPQSRTALWEEVARLVKEEGMTVFLTTQYLEEADIMADRVGIIDHGEIVAEDTPAGLKEEIGRPTVEAIPVSDSDWAAISKVLERFGELSSAAHKGVAVRLAPGVDNLSEIVRALDAEGLKVANLELHAPTLDDVFLEKTGRSLAGAAEEPEPEAPGALEQLQVSVPGVPRPAASE